MLLTNSIRYIREQLECARNRRLSSKTSSKSKNFAQCILLPHGREWRKLHLIPMWFLSPPCLPTSFEWSSRKEANGDTWKPWVDIFPYTLSLSLRSERWNGKWRYGVFILTFSLQISQSWNTLVLEFLQSKRPILSMQIFSGRHCNSDMYVRMTITENDIDHFNLTHWKRKALHESYKGQNVSYFHVYSLQLRIIIAFRSNIATAKRRDNPGG